MSNNLQKLGLNIGHGGRIGSKTTEVTAMFLDQSKNETRDIRSLDHGILLFK
jgi:hypothetical protein